MTSDRIAAIAFTSLVSIVGWTWTLSSSYGSLPQRVTTFEHKQAEAAKEQEDMKNALAHIGGQLDFIVDYVKRNRK